VVHATLVASHDRQLEETLRALGLHVERGTLDSVASKRTDVVIVDLRGEKGLPVGVSVLKRHHPDMGIVIVASALDPALLLEAMRAGVNEVLSEPIVAVDVQQAIDRVTEKRIQAEPGRVFGFVGAKGGVGTTTVAVNVATALGISTKPARVLLMDLHQMGGDAAIFMGAEPRFSVMDALNNMHRLDETFFRTLVIQTAPNTDLLASPERPVAGVFERDRIQRLISFASTVYKQTVVDLPQSDGAVLDVLDELTTIYVVANQELATVKSASRLAAMLRDRYGRDKVTLILSRSDRHAEIGREDVEKAVGAPVTHMFPSDYRVALQALNKGRPVALDNHNDLSASFTRFAHRLAGTRVERDPSRSSGLFGRLTHLRS
jgi:pilus assembly protein CpaE